MVDLIESIICHGCMGIGYCDMECIDGCYIIKYDIYEGIRTWLSSFDTSSATECFTAIGLLKERIEHEGTDQAGD